MKSFKEFEIKPVSEAFVGDKIKIAKILNKEIEVLKYRIVDSNFSGKRLDIQIRLKEEQHVVWTGSKFLMQMIEQIPAAGYPFKTTIVQDNERYLFT